MTCVSTPGLCAPEEISCPKGWITDVTLGCLYFGTTPMTWEEAQDYCDSKSSGNMVSSLVEIHTEAMQNFVSAEKDDSRVYWIGGRDLVEGVWRWEHSAELLEQHYTNWVDDQPPNHPLVDEEDCLELGRWRGDNWNDISCDWAKNHPICHIPVSEDRQCSCCDARKEEEHLPCIDQGCTEEWDGLGQCVNVTKVDWSKAALQYDLSKPNVAGRCSNGKEAAAEAEEAAEGDEPSVLEERSLDNVVLRTVVGKDGFLEDCCRCMKKNPCQDNGCRVAGGQCVDARNENLEKFDLEFKTDLGDELCGAIHEESYCKCFKARNPY